MSLHPLTGPSGPNTVPLTSSAYFDTLIPPITNNKKQKGKSMHPIVEEFPLGHPITDEFPTEGLETPSILYYLD